VKNFCLACGKELKRGRRGLWYYYCNKKCYKQAIENFKEGVRELLGGKNIILVKVKNTDGVSEKGKDVRKK